MQQTNTYGGESYRFNDNRKNVQGTLDPVKNKRECGKMALRKKKRAESQGFARMHLL